VSIARVADRALTGISLVAAFASAYVIGRKEPRLVALPEPGRDRTRAVGAMDSRRATRPAPSSKATDDRGRLAESPTAVPRRGWWDILKRTYAEASDDRLLAVAAGVVFYLLLAIFPGIAAFVSLYGLFADPATVRDHIAGLATILPGGAVEIIGSELDRLSKREGATLGFGFVFGLALALWSANAGMKSIFDGLNVVYEETEKRSFIKLNLISLAFTVGGIAFLLAAIGAVVVLPGVLGLFGLSSAAEWLIALARWPAFFLVVIFALALLYRFGPSRANPQWKWVSPGAVVAAVLWVAGSAALSFYISRFANYAETYGSLGAAIGFMTWLWLTAVVILVGGELNAEAEHQTEADTTTGPPKPMGARGAEMADRAAPV
jgi:membrane protein